MLATFSVGFFTVTSAHAATYYVATNGSDSNPGSEAAPWRSVAHATDKMVAGDTTYVKGGVYMERPIHFGRSGTQSAPIKLLNAPGEFPVIDFGGGVVGVYQADGYHPERARGTDKSVLFSNYGDGTKPIGWITFEGFEVRNGYNGLKINNAHDLVIRRNWIHDHISQGVHGNGLRLLFDRNVINHNGNFPVCKAGGRTDIGSSMCNQVHGIYMYGSSVVITNNLIYDNLAFGIQVNGSPTSAYRPTGHPGPEYAGVNNWIIANNVFAYNYSRAGVTLWAAPKNVRIENNIFYENCIRNPSQCGGAQGVNVGSSARGISIKNNIVYGGSGLAPFSGSGYEQSGNITANPNFEGAGATLSGVPNFKLRAGSPAIDKGQSLSQVTWDHAGGKRPFGAAFDIGAYEFGSPPDSGSPPPNPTGGGSFPSGPPILRGPNGEVCPSGY